MWAFRRKALYLVSFLIIVGGGLIFHFKDVLFPLPRCDDGVKNGYESGVDCGGECSLRCKADTIPLTVEWARAFPLGGGLYDVGVFINNKNTSSAPVHATTTVSFFDEGGSLIRQLTVKDVVPFSTNYPIVLHGLSLPRVPKIVTASIEEAASYRVTSVDPDPLAYTTSFEEESFRRVFVTMRNTSTKSLIRVPVRLVLYDGQYNAFAVGSSKIDSLAPQEEETIVFTWSEELPQKPIKIELYPSISPF